jgi:hypothetical protein
MISKREMVMIIILLLLVTGGAYYFFFYAPTMERISNANDIVALKTQEVFDAEIRQIQYGILLEQRDELAVTWEKYAVSLPKYFDQADILNYLQDVIYPYAQVINVSFPGEGVTDATDAETGEVIQLNAVAVYPLQVNFTVSMDSLMAIFQGLADLEIDNIINQYTLSRIESDETGMVAYSVSMQIGFLVQQSEGEEE